MSCPLALHLLRRLQEAPALLRWFGPDTPAWALLSDELGLSADELAQRLPPVVPAADAAELVSSARGLVAQAHALDPAVTRRHLLALVERLLPELTPTPAPADEAPPAALTAGEQLGQLLGRLLAANPRIVVEPWDRGEVAAEVQIGAAGLRVYDADSHAVAAALAELARELQRMRQGAA